MTIASLFGQRMLIALACLGLAINSVVLFASLDSLIDTMGRVRHSLDVTGELAQVEIQMSSAESSQRGYLLTSDIRYLDPYFSASDIIESKLERLRQLIADNPGQVRHVGRIGELITQKFGEMAETVALQSAGNAAGAAELVRQNSGKEIGLEFRRALSDMEKAEQAVLSERQSEADLARSAAFLTLGGFIATTVLLLAAILYLGRREIARKAQASREHAELAEELRDHSDHLVRERNEVSQINEVSNFLQSCEDMREISRLLGPFLDKLFPRNPGAIHITAASRNRMDLVGSWGGRAFPQHILPQECWGLRRGQVHAFAPNDVAPACDHHPREFPLAGALCIPLVAQGETLGLLSLIQEGQCSDDVDRRDVRRLAEMVARQVGLTLSNIRLRESLRDQSIRDPMTKAFNRRHLEAVVEKEIAKSTRFGRPLSVAMIDIDHFKRFNDTHGHQAGDAALIAVTQHLQSNLRETDWLFRYGGEEFLLLFSEADSQTAVERLEVLRESVSELGIMIDGLPLPHVTISCGTAGLTEHAATFEELVAAADDALYEAKKAGRNQVRCAVKRDVGLTLIA